MPDTPDPQLPLPTDTPEPTPEVPPTTPPPQYMTREEFERITQENQRQFQAMLEQQGRMLAEQMAASARHSAPQARPTGDSDEELQQAFDEGRITAAQMTKKIVEREQARMVTTHLDPMRQIGGDSIGELSKSAVMAMTDGTGKPVYPHFRRYEKEIEEMIRASVPQGTVRTTKMYQDAYRFVLGGHADELMNEAREQAVRSSTPTRPESVPSAVRTARTAPTKDSRLPTIQEVLGEQGAAAIEHKMAQHGMTEDQVFQRMGYKGGWREYYGQIQAQQEEVA